MEVLHLDISWPMELSKVSLTYVSREEAGGGESYKGNDTSLYILRFYNSFVVVKKRKENNSSARLK